MFPLALKLKNERADATADFSIAMKTSATFELIGIGTNQMSLGPCEERCLPLQTLIPKPGVYDLQALEVKMVGSDGYASSFLLPESQWIVTVSQS